MPNAPLPQFGHRSLPRPLSLFLWVFVVYSAITWISCLIHLRHGDSKAYTSPFLHQARDPFTDLRTYRARFDRYFHHEEFFRHFPEGNLPYFSYPAAGATLYEALYRTSHPTIVYLTLAVTWASLLAWGLFRLLRQLDVAPPSAAGVALVMLVGAFPFDFMVERGNVELVVWILVFLGLLLYLRRRAYAAAVLLGVAASLKIFPVIFCGLLLHRRQYRALALGLLTAVACDGLAIWYAGPSVRAAFHGFNQTVTNYQQSYSVPARVADVGMDHSFFALVKVLAAQCGLPYQNWLRPYYLLAGVVAVALFFGRSLRLPFTNQLLFVTVMAVGLPPNSFAYTLVYLYAAWVLLCMASFGARDTGARGAGLPVLLLCFVPLFAPFSLFVTHGVRFGGQVQSLSLVVLLVLCLTLPIDDALWNGIGA